MDEEFSLWVPRNVIVLGAGGSVVFIVHKGHAMERSVETGREGPLGIEITDGLVGDERIVASNLDQITDGLAVTPKSPR